MSLMKLRGVRAFCIWGEMRWMKLTRMSPRQQMHQAILIRVWMKLRGLDRSIRT